MDDTEGPCTSVETNARASYKDYVCTYVYVYVCMYVRSSLQKLARRDLISGNERLWKPLCTCRKKHNYCRQKFSLGLRWKLRSNLEREACSLRYSAVARKRSGRLPSSETIALCYGIMSQAMNKIHNLESVVYMRTRRTLNTRYLR